jgi:alpha-1,6-mannosyltransferase
VAASAPPRPAPAAVEARPSPLRLAPRAPLRVVDVALFYGRRSGGIRAYLDAKLEWALRVGAIEHHLVVPGERERHLGRRHELPSVRVLAANGYRLPVGTRRLKALLRDLAPDVVLLHDPFWAPEAVAAVAAELGIPAIAVHHAGVDFNAAALPGPDALWRPPLRARFRHAYSAVDGVMSVVDTLPDGGRIANLPLRLGLDSAFRPHPAETRGDHVVYVGRLSREKGVELLLEAATRADYPWPLHLVGTGPFEGALAAHVRRLGIEQRVSFRPWTRDRRRLARLYRGAGVVCMPGRHETFGLVALEAAACGARTVTHASAPAAAAIGAAGVDVYRGGPQELLDAIERARARPRDLASAARLALCCSWDAAFADELADLERLSGRTRSAR